MAKKKALMQIPETVLKSWEMLYQTGDIDEIKKKISKPVSSEAIRIFIRKGEARNLLVYNAVVSYYTQKAKEYQAMKHRFENLTTPEIE